LVGPAETEWIKGDSLLIILGDFLIKQISPMNCQNSDSMLDLPPETVIYWSTPQ